MRPHWPRPHFIFISRVLKMLSAAKPSSLNTGRVSLIHDGRTAVIATACRLGAVRAQHAGTKPRGLSSLASPLSTVTTNSVLGRLGPDLAIRRVHQIARTARAVHDGQLAVVGALIEHVTDDGLERRQADARPR